MTVCGHDVQEENVSWRLDTRGHWFAGSRQFYKHRESKHPEEPRVGRQGFVVSLLSFLLIVFMA